VSIFNRWGYKVYGQDDAGGDDPHGPAHGTSLSLMKRLLYSHILYNCVAVGFEGGWFEGDDLSPIGRIQRAANRWVGEHGQPGVMHTPVGLVVDSFSGWTVPRHLSWAEPYRVWGNLPYEPGDHLTDAVLDLIYPGYQDSSYFRDESGFLCPTPFGDMADCLTSDAPPWLLDRYAVLIVAGGLRGGREVRDNLQNYAERGGHVVVTAANLATLPGGLAGRTTPADVSIACGRGRVTFIASQFGLSPGPPALEPLRSDVDAPLPKLFQLQPEVRSRLEDVLRSQQLFRVHGTGLSLITCRKQAGEFTLGVANNTWREQPFRLESLCGEIESLRELPLDQSEKEAVGLTPLGVDPAGLGTGGENTIAGGDVRIFAVRVKEAGVEEIPHVAPPKRPRDRFLNLRRVISIKEAILARPTFFQHFDGVCVDWRVLHEREQATLRTEARWLDRQGVRVVVDVSSGHNLYPTLRLLDNGTADHEASMTAWSDVLLKAEILGARDVVFTLHRDPENNFSGEQSHAGFVATLKKLAAEARTRGITLHLRLGPGKPPRNLAEAYHWLDPADEPNLKLALATAMLSGDGPETTKPGWLDGRLGLWLVAASRRDAGGKVWDVHAPLHASGDLKTTAAWLAATPAVPQILDADCETQDEEYLDAVALEGMRTSPVSTARGGTPTAAPRSAYPLGDPAHVAPAVRAVQP